MTGAHWLTADSRSDNSSRTTEHDEKPPSHETFGFLDVRGTTQRLQICDAPVVDQPRTIQPNVLLHPAVVRHEQQRTVIGLEPLFELLDRGEVEMVRRLIENQHIRASCLQQR
jgi:hypothetical protein